MPSLSKQSPVTPYWQTNDEEMVRLYLGDALTILSSLPSRSMQCVVTSPPYWGMRDYKAGKLELGCEETPKEYVDRMVLVFREVRRVLKDDGVLWLNLGDTYAAGNNRNGIASKHLLNGRKQNIPALPPKRTGLPTGNTCGIPWRVAFALQEDGWILRQDIIWYKPNAMPESATDRCSRVHEYVFLLVKQPNYSIHMEDIKEPIAKASNGRYKYKHKDMRTGTTKWMREQGETVPRGDDVPTRMSELPESRNKKSVWTVTKVRHPGVHFAAFPPNLIEPMILAGSREGDVVLDPFIGSGTTAVVSLQHGRRCIGIDLKEEYLRDHTIDRVKDVLYSNPSTVDLVRGR